MRTPTLYRIFERQYGDDYKHKVDVQKNTHTLLSWFVKTFEKHRSKKVAEYLPVGKRVRVLEIGCGDGRFLEENKAHWKGIVGVDVLPSLIDKAKKRVYGVPYSFSCADFGKEKIFLKKESVNLVVSIATLQYIEDIEHLVKEVHRVLTDNGLFIFEVPNTAVLWRRIQCLFGRLPQTSDFHDGWFGGVIHYFTQHDIQDFLEKNGFVVKKTSCAGILDGLRSLWPSMLGADLIIVCQKKT